MGLILEVIGYKGAPPYEPLSANFSEAGGSIGRKSDNHLVLPDTDQIISRRHGHIEYAGGRFSYHDTSLHGTELCGQGRVLSNDAVPLADGDRLKIGDYELLVTLKSPPLDITQRVFPDFQESYAPARSNIPDHFEPNSSAVLFGDASAPPEPEPISFIGQPDAPSFQENFVPPQVAIPEVSPIAPAQLQIPDDFSIDAFFGGEPERPPEPEQNATESPDDLLSDAFFGIGFGEEPQADPAASEIPIENKPHGYVGEAQPSGIPAQPSASILLPVDGGPAPLPFSFEQEEPTSRQSGGVGDLKSVADNEPAAPESRHFDAPLAAPIATLAATSALNVNTARLDSLPAGPVSFERSEHSLRDQPSPLNPPAGRQANKYPESMDVSLLQCFLEGAEIRDLPNMSPEEQAAAMRLIGSAFREMVDGMTVLLRARMEERREFRASDFTIIGKSGNNPLKFFPDAESTMKAMLLQASHPGYLDAASAVRDGLMDIKSHQLAMRAGIQASLRVILKSFDPQRFEALFKDSFSFKKGAKCWDAYSKDYPKLVDEAMENLFKDSFAEVYEKQVRILQESHDKD